MNIYICNECGLKLKLDDEPAYCPICKSDNWGIEDD